MRLGRRLKGSVVRNVFPTKDEQWVSISCSTPRHVGDLAALVGHNPSDPEGRPSGDVEGSVATWSASRTRDEVVEGLVAARIPVAPVYSARDCWDDPHMQARACLPMVTTTENGPVASPAPAPRLTGSPAPVHDRTPDLGEDDVDELLAAWGPVRALGIDFRI